MASRSVSARAVDPDHPWLGLASFDEATQEWFFGRDREIRDLFRRVRECPLTVLFGRSGLGKTSLLGAGLLPKLRVEGYRPVLLRLRLDEDAPPLVDQVQAAVDRAVGPVAGTIATLWERFCHLPNRPADLSAAPPVIVFDQFEEVFTLATEPRRLSEQARLATELADLVEHRPPEQVQRRLLADSRLSRDYDFGPSPVRVVIALREDYLSLIESWNRLMPAVMRNRMQLRELNGPQALEAVVKPGRRAGADLVDDEVGGRIVRFVADRPAGTPLEAIAAVPPLLSLVCDELNEARIAARLPAITADLVDHQSRDILRNFYERAFDGVPDTPLEQREGQAGSVAAGAIRSAREEVRRFVEDRLVTVSGHRTPVAREDAVEALAAAGVPAPVDAIDHLLQGRLLTAEERDGLQRLEITHDVLADLVVRSRDDRRERERARRTEEALAAQRRRARRQRAFTTALGVLALVSLAASGVAWWQARKANAALERVSRNDLEAARHLLEERRVQELLVSGRPPQWSRGLALLARAATAASNAEATRVLYDEVVDYLAEADVRVPHLPPFRHDGATCIAFDRGGGRMASGGTDGTVKIWNLQTGGLDREIRKLPAAVQALSFAPDGTLLVAAVQPRSQTTAPAAASDGQRTRSSQGREGSAEIRQAWIAVGDTTTRDVTVGIGTEAVVPIDFSADGRRYAVVSREDVRILTTSGHEPVGKPIMCAKPVAARLSPDGRFVAIVLADGAGLLRRVEPEGEDPPFAFPRAPTPDTKSSATFENVSDLAWLRSGDCVVVSHGGNVEMWNPFGTDWAKIQGGTAGSTMAISPDDLFAVVGEGPIAQVVPLNQTTMPGVTSSWDVETGSRTTFPTGTAGTVTSLAFSRDWARSVVATDGGMVSVRAGKTDSQVVAIPDAGSVVACSPDGTQIATAAGATTLLRDASTGRILHAFKGHSGDVTSVAFGPDGRRLVTAAKDDTPRVWDVASGAEIVSLEGHADWVRAVAFSPEGDTVATASDDGTARMWDAADGRELAVLPGHPGYVWCVAFSPDGRQIATGSADGCRVWDANTRELVARYHDPAHVREAVVSVAFSPDGQRLASASRNATLVRNLTGRLQVRRFPGATHVRFSPDGLQVVTVSEARAIRIILQTPIGAPFVHDSPVTATAWSAAGDHVATLDAAGSIRIWDAETRSPPAGFTASDPFASARSQAVGGRLSPITADWVTALGGIRFDEQGLETVIDREQRERILRETTPDDPVWSHLAAWLRARGPDRTVAPFDTVTVRQRALEQRSSDDVWRCWLIPEYDPACPGVRLRLAADTGEEGLQRLLRRIDVERVPDTFQDLLDATELLDEKDDALVGLGADSRRCAAVAAELAARAAALPGERTPVERTALAALQRRAGMHAAADAADWSDETLEWFRETAAAAGAKAPAHHDLVWALLAAGRRDEAHAAWLAFTKAFAAADQAAELDELAWTGILIPALPPDDLTHILAWSRRAVELEPTNEMFLETLGAAELRAGDPAAAVTTLERSRARQKMCTDWTLLHLAIARGQVGDGIAARQILDDLVAASEPTERPWRSRLVWRLLRPEAEQAAAKAPEPSLVENSIGMQLVPLRPGRFVMGSTDKDNDGESDELPAHEVRITRPFLIGRTEVTNAQWERVMGETPIRRKDDDLPIESVTWNEAGEFCRRLSAQPAERQAGRAYRLPTEAEWEYACRAGTQTRFWFGNDDAQLARYDWVEGNSNNQTHPVATKQPNPWGLFDMHGNVLEWCSDRYGVYDETSPASDPQGPNTGEERVVRGGGGSFSNGSSRSAHRKCGDPTLRREFLGFRVVVELE